MVTVDSARGCVVLSLRGTLTMQDIVTDLVLEPVSVETWLPAEFVKVGDLAAVWNLQHLATCKMLAPTKPAAAGLTEAACLARGLQPVLQRTHCLIGCRRTGEHEDKDTLLAHSGCLAAAWQLPRPCWQTCVRTAPCLASSTAAYASRYCDLQEHADKGTLLAHSGCVAAASAVLADLREDGTLFGILHELRCIAGHSMATTPTQTPRASEVQAEASTSGQVSPLAELTGFSWCCCWTGILQAVRIVGEFWLTNTQPPPFCSWPCGLLVLVQSPAQHQAACLEPHQSVCQALLCLQEGGFPGSFTGKGRRESWVQHARGMQTLERMSTLSPAEDEVRDMEPLALKAALSKKCALLPWLSLFGWVHSKPCVERHTACRTAFCQLMAGNDKGHAHTVAGHARQVCPSLHVCQGVAVAATLLLLVLDQHAAHCAPAHAGCTGGKTGGWSSRGTLWAQALQSCCPCTCAATTLVSCPSASVACFACMACQGQGPAATAGSKLQGQDLLAQVPVMAGIEHAITCCCKTCPAAPGCTWHGHEPSKLLPGLSDSVAPWLSGHRRCLTAPWCADLECWPIAPPGGLLSPALSAAVAPWCTGLITGKDAVPRLSMGTARLLMDHCVYALAMCKLPKMQCALYLPASPRGYVC